MKQQQKTCLNDEELVLNYECVYRELKKIRNKFNLPTESLENAHSEVIERINDYKKSSVTPKEIQQESVDKPVLPIVQRNDFEDLDGKVSFDFGQSKGYVY